MTHEKRRNIEVDDPIYLQFRLLEYLRFPGEVVSQQGTGFARRDSALLRPANPKTPAVANKIASTVLTASHLLRMKGTAMASF
jgi:hypothetical protein